MRYSIEYSSTTGYGWTEKSNTLKDYKGFIEEMRNNYYTHLTIWDSKKKDFIFWKRALQRKPDIDNLKS